MVDDQTDFLQELKQRKVFRVAVAYIVVAWVALQFLDLVLENIGAPSWVMQAIMALLAIGFPGALVLALGIRCVGRRYSASAPARAELSCILVVVVTVALRSVTWAGHLTGREVKTIQTASVADADLRVYRFHRRAAVRELFRRPAGRVLCRWPGGYPAAQTGATREP